MKVLPGEEYAPKHKLLVEVMKLKGIKSKHRRFEPRLRLWKLKNNKIREEFGDLMYAAVDGKGQEWSNINDRWKFMKGTMMLQ